MVDEKVGSKADKLAVETEILMVVMTVALLAAMMAAM